ncbi:MAG: hypothetical protein KHY88_07115 [Erysipelotrichaceae bacterium]|nr:hypothetical protein [Erysipelotrichaceae bacterium]
MVQITWEKFISTNYDVRGIRYKFEDLSRQLFTYEYLSKNKEHKYVHSNPNNAGVESEPIFSEESNKYISYQAKFFDNAVGYDQIKDSAEKAVKHYRGRLDIIYLFCNKPLTTTCKSYIDIEHILNGAGISLEPITDTTILDLVRKHQLLAKYYFDDHEISHHWLVDQASATVDILGERFNEDFNIDTEASKNLTVFLQNKKALDYFNDKKRNLIKEIETLKWELGDLYPYAYRLSKLISTLSDVNSKTIYDVENWQNIISSTFETDINEIKDKILKTQKDYAEIQDNDDKAKALRIYLRKLDKLKSLYYRLELSEIERKLLDSKILVVEGEAGIGKTQLFANEAVTLLNEGEDALLIIGSNCLSKDNILKQLEDNLRLNFKFEELIDILEVIGETSEKIIPIFIDALNESWHPQLWKSVLPVLYQKVVEKNFVRLAISFRSEYEKTILPDNFLEYDDVMKIEHYGFKGNSLEAAKRFLDHYGIPFTPLHMFTSNIDNPLFLTLYCKTYQGDEVELPVLYERLLEKANDKMHIKLATAIEHAGYDQSYNIVLPIIESISKQILLTGKRHFERDEIVSMTIWNEMGLSAIPFVTQLIRENILHDYESNGKYYLYFTYDQMNDYFSAKTILSMFSKENDIRDYLSKNILGIVDGKFKNWDNEGLFVHVCALYAEKYKKECIEIISDIKDETDKKELFRAYLESFEWRGKIYLTIPKLLKLCNEYYVYPSVLWRVFINNSVKQGHLLSADSLHNVLKTYDLARRDYLWTTFINEDTSDDNRLVQLIKSYNKGEILEISDKEQIRLLLILFSWVLTSSNRWLRDTTSKAMIEILKVHFEYNEYILELFSEINDPYVIQRLYGIVFGACVKRKLENKEEYKSLVSFVFNSVFNKESVYPDILLRDYARLIIERFLMEYPDELKDYDLKKIKPPYNSIPIPDIGDQDYTKQKFEKGLYSILSSMRFEGMGMYGDFGRYVFQSAIGNFEVDHCKIFNYAMYFIINELKYQSEFFDDYDGYINRFTYGMEQTAKTERIGKKYQWIAMYNILARISDYYPMKNTYSMEDETVEYEGPWEPYVRDFDPTLNEYNLFSIDAPYFSEVNEHMKKAIQEIKNDKSDSSFDEEVWINSNSLFFQYQKEDLLLTDNDGTQWVVLSKYADTDRKNLKNDKLLVWNWLYGYFVTTEQLDVLKKYVDKKINLLNSDVTGIPHTYTLYNREYPWSSGSKAMLKWQWINYELKTGETKQVSKTVEQPDISVLDAMIEKYLGKVDIEEQNDVALENQEDSVDIPIVTKTYITKESVTINLGKILCATQELLWEEEFDASKKDTISNFHPCAEIINVLKLKQKKYDGYYYDESGKLIAFDTDLSKQRLGLVIRKESLDKFLDIKNLYLVWFVNASKEVHDKSLAISRYTDWTGLLEYNNNSIEGEYYKIESVQE